MEPTTVNPEPLPDNPAPAPTPKPEPIVTPPISDTPAPKKSNLIPLLLVLGLVVAIALPVTLYFTGNLSTPQTEAPVSQPLVKASPTAIPFFLTVLSPSDTTAAVAGEILVSGKTLPGTTVAIVTDSDDELLESDASGNFESTVVVGNAGGNLQITAYGTDGEEKTQTFTISPTPGLSGSIDLNSLKVFAAAIAKNDNNNGRAVGAANRTIGSLTVVPTKSPRAQAFLQNKVAVKIVKKLGVKALKELLAENSSASGLLKNKNKIATGSGLLKHEKWLVKFATAGATLKRRAVSGVITDVSAGMITVSHLVQRDRVSTIYYNLDTIITTKDSRTASASALVVGARVAAVGEITSDGLLAKRIHVIPGKATGAFLKNPVASKSADVDLTPPTTPSATLTPTLTLTPTTTASPSAGL